MLNTVSRSVLVGGWFATLAVIVGFSVAIGASPSTSVLLLVLGVTLAIIVMLISGPKSSPTVAEILYSVETKDGH